MAEARDSIPSIAVFVFCNDAATTEIYTLSLHDALPISAVDEGNDPEVAEADAGFERRFGQRPATDRVVEQVARADFLKRSEEHTSELQSRQYLDCRLLLEKKKLGHILSCS